VGKALFQPQQATFKVISNLVQIAFQAMFDSRNWKLHASARLQQVIHQPLRLLPVCMSHMPGELMPLKLVVKPQSNISIICCQHSFMCLVNETIFLQEL
jgi:hypothetical protein